MKSITLFVLLVYWSVIILAPVLAKELKLTEKELIITPKIKPILSSNYNKKIIRPLFSGLDNDKLSKEFNLNIEKRQLSLKYILQLKLKNL